MAAGRPRASGTVPAATYPHVRLADRAVGRLSRLVLELLRQLRGDFTPATVAHLAPVAPAAIVASAAAPELVTKKTTTADIEPVLVRLIEQAVGVTGRFDQVNALAVSAARRQAGALIDGIDAQTRQLVARLVAQGQLGELTPEAIAQRIRPLIGLNASQADTALRYFDALNARFEAERYGADAANALRGRFAFSPWRGGPLDGRVERLYQQYVDRQLRYRAQMIARTETIRAASEGDQLAWSQRIAAGDADGYEVVQTWSVTRDDRACPLCLALDGEQVRTGPVSAGARPDLGTLAGFDGVGHPPRHPGCRCVLITTMVAV